MTRHTIISRKTNYYQKNKKEIEESVKDERSTCKRCILQNCRKRKTNLNMACVDYKKAYNMVPHSWIITTMGVIGLADNIIGLIKQRMNKWKTNLYADGKLLAS